MDAKDTPAPACGNTDRARISAMFPTGLPISPHRACAACSSLNVSSHRAALCTSSLRAADRSGWFCARAFLYAFSIFESAISASSLCVTASDPSFSNANPKHPAAQRAWTPLFSRNSEASFRAEAISLARSSACRISFRCAATRSVTSRSPRACFFAAFAVFRWRSISNCRCCSCAATAAARVGDSGADSTTVSGAGVVSTTVSGSFSFSGSTSNVVWPPVGVGVASPAKLAGAVSSSCCFVSSTRVYNCTSTPRKVPLATSTGGSPTEKYSSSTWSCTIITGSVVSPDGSDGVGSAHIGSDAVKQSDAATESDAGMQSDAGIAVSAVSPSS